ncbi:protocadherin-10 [Nematolebias whitei]|uniref:protocadherin-10 n=1 Tax=Nematolebias whitei TaxID=451745 RepID=UPI00189A19E9|nr:protocadherin-10 [Nematolebias whitei]
MELWAAVFVWSAVWRCALSVTRYSIAEEMERGSVVANLAADLGLELAGLAQREVKLDIFTNKKYLDFNKKTGDLYVVEKIDREYLCPAKPTCFLKLDFIIESPLRIFNIELGITDINDNAPHFRRDRVELDVSESATPGERFSLPNAVDPDVGVNTIKTYKLSASEHFTIEIQTGSDGTQYVDLVLTNSLDREEKAAHNLILTAEDGGVPVRSGTANIIVRVQDTNDNPPRFDQPVYIINMTENTPIGTLVTKLNATDLDEGLNSEIVYSFTLYTSEKTQDVFELHPNTGEVTVKGTIDYEEMRFYEMHIEARDKGAHPLLGQCKMVIHVTDMNDNYPEITVQSVKNTVAENIPVGSVIALVGTGDRDSGDNGKVTISIHDKMSFILSQSLDRPTHYELIVSELLDREKVPEYVITLIVTDGGTPPLSDNETLTVHLLDVNDNAPQFPQSFYTIRVMENSAPGAVHPLFSLLQNWYVALFIFLSSRTGTVLTVTHYSVPEEMEEGSVVAHLATDLGLDVKSLSKRKMRVDVVGNKKYLDINKDTGELFIRERIDREFLCPLKTATTCFLKLDASIENPVRMFNIEVEITDINDNSPHFRRGTMHLDISESTPVGERFSLNNAADPDVGVNSVKNYHLSASDQFSIEIQTGRDGTKFADLVLKEPLDREHQAVHNLILTAVDGGVPTRTGTASIIVRVLDVNDNAPSFDKDKYVVDVMENSPIGSLVINLNAMETAVKAYSDMTEMSLEYDIFSDINLYLVIGLGSVSFLLLITILVTIVLKCQKAKPSKAAPPSRNSVVSERNSTIADSTLVSNDAYWYSLFLAETRKGKLVVRQPVPKGSRYIVSSIPRGTGLSETSDSAASTLQYPK